MFYIDIAQQYRSPKTIVVFSRPETEIVWRICHIFLNRSYSFYLDFFKKPCFYLREPFHSFFPLLKLRGVGGFMLLKFGQRGGSWKNCWEIGGLVERGEGPFRKRRISKLFHQLSFRKACFHYYWIFFVWQLFTLVITRLILSCGFLFRKKWYFEFLFLLFLFLTIILGRFHC